MKRIVLVAMMVAAAGPALAISRYNSNALTCDGARQAIRSEGAVILRYPSKRTANMTLYDRYVRSSDFCDPHEFADRAVVETRDNARCPVLVCQPKSKLDDTILLPWNRL